MIWASRHKPGAVNPEKTSVERKLIASSVRTFWLNFCIFADWFLALKLLWSRKKSKRAAECRLSPRHIVIRLHKSCFCLLLCGRRVCKGKKRQTEIVLKLQFVSVQLEEFGSVLSPLRKVYPASHQFKLWTVLRSEKDSVLWQFKG